MQITRQERSTDASNQLERSIDRLNGVNFGGPSLQNSILVLEDEIENLKGMVEYCKARIKAAEASK